MFRRCLTITSTLAVSLLTLSATPVVAQTTDRSGIEGRVTDETQGVLPGVTVTLASPAIQGGEFVASTHDDGRYRFTALPLGVYELTFELAGFQTVRRTDLRLNAGFVATIDIRMTVGGVAETLTVRGESPVVDVRTTAVSTNFTQEALETLPTSRTMWQLLAMSPGIRVTGQPDVGGNQTGNQSGWVNYGSVGGGNRPTLDGVDTREVNSGAGFYYDYGTFEEVQVKGMGNDAEMALSGTNFVGIIKSGGNDFHGGGLFQWETPALQSSNVDDALRAKGVRDGNPLKQYYDFNIDLGGRVIRDKVWFYGAAHRQKIATGVIGYSRTAGPDGVFGTLDDEPGEYVNTLTNYTGKATAQLTNRHKLQSFYQWNRKLFPERGGTANPLPDAFTPAESTIRNQLTPYAGKIEWSWTASDRSLVNFLVGRHFFRAQWDPAYPGSGPAKFDAVTLRNSGTSIVNNNSTSDRGRWQYTGSFSHHNPDLWRGAHDFKIGFELTQEEYLRSVKSRATDGDYQLIYQRGIPFQIVTRNSPVAGVAREAMQSAYVKDSWRVAERLTVNAGVRWDRYSSYLPAQSKAVGQFSVAADFPAKDILSWSNVVPRLGMSWALTADNRKVVKVTWGRFLFPLLPDYSSAFNGNGEILTTYLWSDLDADLLFDDGEIGRFISSTGSSNRFLNEDLGQPKTDEFTASYEQEVANQFSGRVSYVYKRNFNQYQSVNTARPFGAYNIAITTTDPGPDGVRGTGDDGGAVTYHDYGQAFRGPTFERFTDLNTEGNTSTYQSIELVANRRLADRWQMLVAYLATKRDEWRSGVGVPQDPNAAAFFPKDETWEWNLRAVGSYQMPFDVQVAGVFTHQSGMPYAREVRFTEGLQQLTQLIVLAEPLGARRYPHQNLLNIRIEKQQKLWVGQASFQFDLFNTLNTNVATTLSARSGPSFERITAIVPPRIARLGVTYKF